MVLKVLDALGPQHGYGIARRIKQVSQQVLQLSERDRSADLPCNRAAVWGGSAAGLLSSSAAGDKNRPNGGASE